MSDGRAPPVPDSATPRITRLRAAEAGAAEAIDQLSAIDRLSFTAPPPREVLEQELAREFACVDVLRERDGGPIVAYSDYWQVRDEIHLLNLAVHPEARRRGHAARLLGHAIGFARAHGCRWFTLEVRRGNHAAIRLYRAHGFRAVGLRPGYYADNREDAIVMLLEPEPTA